MDVTITRRNIKKDYFQSTTGGYFGSNAQIATTPRHWETGRVTDLAYYSFIYFFPKAFAAGTIPVAVKLDVYRMVENEPNVWVKQNVLNYKATNAPTATEFGFGLVIDATEDLAGVIIEFAFTE